MGISDKKLKFAQLSVAFNNELELTGVNQCTSSFFACRTIEQVLKLEDPNSLEDDMGVIVLNLSLAVKQEDIKRSVSGLGNQTYSWNVCGGGEELAWSALLGNATFIFVLRDSILKSR